MLIKYEVVGELSLKPNKKLGCEKNLFGKMNEN